MLPLNEKASLLSNKFYSSWFHPTMHIKITTIYLPVQDPKTSGLRSGLDRGFLGSQALICGWLQAVFYEPHIWGGHGRKCEENTPHDG